VKRKIEWLDPADAGAFLESGTNAFRIAWFAGGWVERFGRTVLISARSSEDSDAACEGLQTWGALTGWMPDRVFRRWLVRDPGVNDTPELILGDRGDGPCETVSECGLFYGVDFSSGYSPGLFCDQRANRRYLRTRTPRHLLNTFSYTCAFSVAAAAAGAETCSVDASKAFLQRGRRNFEMNGINPATHRFVTEDVPTYLSRLVRRGATFDAIILDPPTFGRGGGGKTFRAQRDFPSLVSAAAQLAAPGCAILLSTNFAEWTCSQLEALARPLLPAGTRFHREPNDPDFRLNCPSSTLWALLPEETPNRTK